MPGTDTPTSWRERLAAVRYIPPLLRLVWDSHPGYAVVMIDMSPACLLTVASQ